MLRRSRARFFSFVALAAIALQMVAAFGHSHAGAGHLGEFESASINCFEGTGASCHAPSRLPDDHDQSGNACLICLAAHQASAAIPPAAPEITLSGRTALAGRPFLAAADRLRACAANFDARGPPAA